MSNNNHVPIFSQPLDAYVNELLGDNHYRNIDVRTAQLIIALPHWNEYCHVQFIDRNEERLKYPVLWHLHAWRIDTESWRVAKARSDRQRIERFLFQANVELIRRALMKLHLLTEDQAGMIATRWLRNNHLDRIAAIKVKLKTKEEEL